MTRNPLLNFSSKLEKLSRVDELTFRLTLVNTASEDGAAMPATRSECVGRLLKLAAMLCCLTVIPGSAAADDLPQTNFPVERLLGAPGGRGIISLEDPAVVGHLTGYIHLLASSGHRPMLLALDEGRENPTMLEPVTQASSLLISAALELHRKARFSLALPLLVLDGGRLQGLGQERDYPPMSAGDLRVGFTFNLVDSETIPLEASTRAEISLPTGDAENFAGVDEPGLLLRLLLGSSPVDWLHVIGQFGAIFHDKREFYGSHWGQRLTWGIGFQLGLPWIPVVGRYVSVLAEVDSEVCLDCSTEDPVEVRGGLRFQHGRWQAGLSAGAGLTDAATVPAWRITAGLGVRLGREPLEPGTRN